MDPSAVAFKKNAAALCVLTCQVAETNARELYLRPVTPQQLLARLPVDQLAVRVSREDLEVRVE